MCKENEYWPQLRVDDKACFRITSEGKKEPRDHHSYAWSGKMPCTGIYRCVYCGALQDPNTRNGKT